MNSSNQRDMAVGENPAHIATGAPARTHNWADSRRYARREGNLLARLTILQAWAPGVTGDQPVAVVVRNFSRNGLCFLYSAQLFPDDEVALDFSNLSRRYRVVRCRRLAADSFEIGAQLLPQTPAPGTTLPPGPVASVARDT